MARTQPAWLTYRHDSGQQHAALAHDVTTLGRSDTCAIVIPLPTVSRLHARIEVQHDRYLLFDADSANGTFVNGNRVAPGYVLSTGDEIWLGSPDAALNFVDPEETLVMPINVLPPALEIDEQAHSVSVYGSPVLLSPLEYGMLVHLARDPGTVCTRESCFRAVWGQPYDHATCEDALNACVAKLRRNLRAIAEMEGHAAPQITTIPRVGFRLDTDAVFVQRSDQPVTLLEQQRGG